MSIDQALTIIQEYAFENIAFSIRFITMDGEERYYTRARYGAPDHWVRKKEKLDINEKLGTAYRKGRKVSLMRDDGMIPITDLGRNEFKTPKWFSITELNGEKVF
jgi:hypothetical protein